MHICLPVQPSTLPQAARLLERISDLGGVSQYPCVLVSAGELDLAPLHKLAASAFQGVSVFPVDMPENHPRPDNVIFQRTAQHMGMQVGDAYLYLEPDSWPTSSHWFKDLVSAYREHNLKFMGKFQLMPDGSGEHYMMATGAYPKDFYFKSDLIRQIPASVNAAEFLQGEIVYRGKAHDSGLFALAGEDHRNAALVLGAKHKGLHEMFASIPDELYQASGARPEYVGSSLTNPRAESVALKLHSHFVNTGQLAGSQSSMSELPLSSEAVKLDESWINDPRALDPNVEVPTPVAAAVIPEGLPDSGHLPSFPQPAEPVLVFDTEEERSNAIKQDHVAGMGWRELLGKYKVSTKVMKGVLNTVG